VILGLGGGGLCPRIVLVGDWWILFWVLFVLMFGAEAAGSKKRLGLKPPVPEVFLSFLFGAEAADS